MKNIRPISVLQSAILCAALLVAGGCGLFKSSHLETGGAYTKTESSAAMPELFLADSAFDVAQKSLDVVFKYEYDNRAALAVVAPKFRPALAQVRNNAWQASIDYATARAEYLRNPISANLTPLNTIVAKLGKLNAAALALMQSKGN